MNAPLFDDIIRRLRNEDSRWEGILDLKMAPCENDVDALIRLLKDPDWIVRWSVSEKLGDIGDIKALRPLLGLLSDDDFHVQKNAMKAIEKFGEKMVSLAVLYFQHEHVYVRKNIYNIFLSLGEKGVPLLRKEMGRHSWVINNFILYTLYKINPENIDDILKEALLIPCVQKNAIVFLGIRRDPKMVPELVSRYEKPSLRRLILYAIKIIGRRESFSFIVRLLNHPSIYKQAVDIIIKIGHPILPNLVISLTKPGFSNQQLIELIQKIGVERVRDKLEILAKKDPEIERLMCTVRAPGDDNI